MELTELSLAPKLSFSHEKSCNSSSSPDQPADGNNFISKKRKSLPDQLLISASGSTFQTSLVDLQVNDPLPQDWEQFLDLQSGRMYYFNRKTLRKSWSRPKDQKLDLELNISNCTSPHHQDHHLQLCSNSIALDEDAAAHCKDTASSSGSTNMVALACLNCHLLVILSKSSPSCPNCKYVHSLSNLQNQPSSSTIKPMPTLMSLLN